MITFGSRTLSGNFANTFTYQPPPEKKDDSKIPFFFAAVSHELFDKGLDPVAIGVYCGIAKYVDLREQIFIGDRVLIIGYTIPVSQQTLADRLNTSRRTVIRKVKELRDAGEIECYKTQSGCYVYRLTAYKDGIEAVQQQQDAQTESEANDYLTAEPHAPTSPVAPTPEQMEQYEVQDDASEANSSPETPAVTDVHRICDDLAHIKDILKELKEPLSSSPLPTNEIQRNRSNNDKREEFSKGKKDEPALSAVQTQQDDDEGWQEYRKYAHAFYGQIRSRRFLQEVSVFFEEKVDEYGTAPDGVDRVMEMIPKVKKHGGKTHIAFDKGFGIDALEDVMEEEKRRLARKKAQDAQAEGEHSFPFGNSSIHSPVDPPGSQEVRSQDDEQDSHQNVPSRPRDAKETVYIRFFARHGLAGVEVGQPYTDADTDQHWHEAYQEFGQPENAQEWVDDRLYFRDKLAQHDIKPPYTDTEMDQLRQEACALYPPSEQEGVSISEESHCPAGEKV